MNILVFVIFVVLVACYERYMSKSKSKGVEIVLILGLFATILSEFHFVLSK